MGPRFESEWGHRKGGGTDMLILTIGSCVLFAACLITLWLMP